jgi:thymidylate kinase
MSRDVEYPCAVVVGADHAGKSTVIRALLARNYPVISCDDDLLEPPYTVLAKLRQAWGHAMASGQSFSREFMLTGLQLPLFYMRDEMSRRRGIEPVVMDSYYYKVLAKCRLLRLEISRMTTLWREFPDPDLVIVLAADDEALWQRSGRGKLVNPFEHYGAEVSKDSYLAFQRDLLREIRKETRHLPCCEVDANEDPDVVLQQVQAAVAEARIPAVPPERVTVWG